MRLPCPSGQRVLLAEEAGDVWETLWHLRLCVIPGHDPTIWPEMRQAPAYYA
jgi:hypothetical protein